MSSPYRTTSALVWFGLLGAPAAWALEHVVGVGLTEATCHEAGHTWHISLDTWTAVASAVTLAVAIAGVVAALLSLARTRDAGTEPPGARLRFLAKVAVTVAPLVLCIIVMDGVSVLVISSCRQS